MARERLDFDEPYDRVVESSPRDCRYLVPSRITLNPDCGFAPGSAADVSLGEVYTKLKNEVAAAKRLRERNS
jgi:methionine synthase II (cobalamin-independent)